MHGTQFTCILCKLGKETRRKWGEAHKNQKKSSFVAHLLITAVVASRWLGNEHDYSQSSPVLSSLVPIYKLAGERHCESLAQELNTMSPARN